MKTLSGLPWTHKAGKILCGPTNSIVIAEMKPSTKADVNAAFIVRAVNTHEELLDIVRDLAKFAPYWLEQRAARVIAEEKL